MARYDLILLGNISFEIPIYPRIGAIVFTKRHSFISGIHSFQRPSQPLIASEPPFFQ